MNLLSAVLPAISAINVPVSAQLYASTGSTTAGTGKRTPTYAAPLTGNIDVQALSGKELAHLNNLNIGGVLRKIYLRGAWDSIVRKNQSGGDKFVFSHADITNGTWLVVHNMEQWADWSCVAVQLQVGS